MWNLVLGTAHFHVGQIWWVEQNQQDIFKKRLCGQRPEKDVSKRQTPIFFSIALNALYTVSTSSERPLVCLDGRAAAWKSTWSSLLPINVITWTYTTLHFQETRHGIWRSFSESKCVHFPSNVQFSNPFKIKSFPCKNYQCLYVNVPFRVSVYFYAIMFSNNYN